MSTRIRYLALTALAALVLLGCKLAEQAGISSLPTPTFAPASSPTPASATVSTPISSSATATATATSASPGTPEVTPGGPNLAATQTQFAIASPTFLATSTPAVNVQEREMKAVIQRLVEEGVVASDSGTYYDLGEFDESMAQIQYLRYWYTDYAAENFVITADTAWQSASETANWPDSGCGFVFSLDEQDNFYYIYLGLDGYVRLVRNTASTPKLQAAERFGRLDIPDGEASVMLVVNNQQVHYYVNDQPVLSAHGAGVKNGTIALTLLSGTNKDFGTRCQMTDINLWVIE